MGRKLLSVLTLAFALGSAHAGIALNEVGAFLVYPGVAATIPGEVETFLTITNTSSTALLAHVSFINGDARDPQYCYECDFDVPLTGLDTETLVLKREAGRTVIENLDTGARRSCSQKIGFVTVDAEDETHKVLTDNVLLGSEIVVDYVNGAALSLPAIPNQGGLGNGDRIFEFDNFEYGAYPSVLGTDFLAPDTNDVATAFLVLYTLAFDRQFPPLTDCSVIGIDAFESQFSNSMQFGCWTLASLRDIDPEFAYPELGIAFDGQEHGWLQLACTVFGTGSKNGVVEGGVHGAIAQYVHATGVLRRAEPGPPMGTAAAWSRILYQSRTDGDPMFLTLSSHGGGF